MAINSTTDLRNGRYMYDVKASNCNGPDELEKIGLDQTRPDAKPPRPGRTIYSGARLASRSNYFHGTEAMQAVHGQGVPPKAQSPPPQTEFVDGMEVWVVVVNYKLNIYKLYGVADLYVCSDTLDLLF